MTLPPTLSRAEASVRARALAYPEAVEEFPWGHRAIKVRGKAFVFLASDGGVLSLSAKLPASADVARALPFVEPTGYGLGRSGWVTARFRGRDRVPLDLLATWIDESYRAIAPKRLVAGLPSEDDNPVPPKPRSSPKARRHR